MMHRTRAASYLALTLIAAMACGAVVVTESAAQAAAKKVQSIEGITEYRLDNGLQVLLYPDPSKPTVTVNLTVLVGSRHEGYGETGMAHLLEHMVFKGTPTHHGKIPKALQERGASFNGTHLGRPHQLLRDAAGQRGQPGVRPASWKPTGWSTASSSRRTCSRR